MLLRINTISNFTRIKKFSWHRDTNDFKRINLIYGGNGVGKTTITNLIRLYSNEADVVKSDIIEKHKNGDEFSLEVVASSGNLKIDKKQQKHNLKILVFNQSFVEDHVFNGKSINAKGFADVATQDQLSNPAIKKMSDSLKILNEKQRITTVAIDKLDKQFVKQKKKVSDYINDRVKAFRMPPIPNLSSLATLSLEEIQKINVDEVDKLCKDFNVVSSQDSLDEEIKKIKLFQLSPLNGGFVDAKETFNRSILANARNRVREIVDSMPVGSTSWGKWYEDGKVLLETFAKDNKNECPLCGGREVQIMDIVSVLNDFFSDEWKTITSELKDFRSLIQSVERGSDNVFENITLLNNSLKKIKRDGVDVDVIITLKKKIKDNLDALDILCSNKEKDLSQVLSEVELLLLDSGDQLVVEMNDRILEIQKEFAILVKEIDESFISNVIEAKIKAKAKLLVVKYMIDDGASNSLFEEYNKASEESRSSKVEYEQIQMKLTEEIKKLKAEASLINNHLKNLSFFNFSVDFDSESKSGISINYENGNTKKELSFSLSEGEKTGLSFAYFLSKVQYEVLSNPDEDKTNFIILIDDPISSLDDRRLYTTSFIIKEFFKDFSQVFVLSHNLNFLKFFGSVIEVDKRSDYLIEFSNGVLSLKNAPLALTNYGTTYFLKLKDLIKYQEKNLAYDDAKKFLPTHCRIVLESFLSFKFFLLSKRSGNDRFKTPGLDRIIGLLESQSGSYKHFKEVNGISPKNICSKLENIKRLTDSHSHGGNHLFDEFVFIDESELDELCEDTLSVIRFFDNIHYEKTSEEELSA